MPRTPRPRAFASLLLLAVAPGLIGLAAAGCTSQAKREAAIRALLDREIAAINGRDLKELGEIWAQDDAILMFDVATPGRLQGWERIGRQWRDFFEQVSELSLKADAVRVQVAGDVAYATYDWAMTGRMGDYALDDRGQATSIYRRGDEGWRLVHAHYSAVPPAPPEGAAGASPPAEGAAGLPAPSEGAAGTPR